MIDPTASTYRGWPLERLCTDRLELQLVPGQGGTILGLRYLREGRDPLPILGETPWGLRPHGQINPPASAGAIAMETWPGGWRTLFPNAGRSSVANGVELGETGEACLAGYQVERDGDTAMDLAVRLVRVPYALSRRIELDGATVRLTETIRNEGGEDVDVMWASELTFAAPLLAPGATVDSGATIVRPDTDVVSSVSWDDLMPWPRAHGNDGVINLRVLPGPDADETRKVYLSDFTEPTFAVTNHAEGVRVGLRWDADAWPYGWYTLEAGHSTGFPYYKGGYLLTLAASSSWPARGIHEARRLSELLTLAPGAERTAELTLTVEDIAG